MIGISADSTCDLSPQLLEQYDIAITPLHILSNGKSYRDGVEITPDQLFAMVEETGELASTAAVSVGEYMDFFSDRRKHYDALIHFTISSEMSSCYPNACVAADDFEHVFIIDSRNLSTGIGHLVLDAAMMAREGCTAEEIVRCLEAKKEKLDVSFVLHTLDYMRQGGRCSTIAALGANLLRLRQCIGVKDGTMRVEKKYRGTLESALSKYVRDRLANPETIDTSRLFISYSKTSKEVVDLVEQTVRECLSFETIYRTDAGCTISNHCGPNCVGILFYRT